MAWKYDILVTKEDYNNNLIKCINEICPLNNLIVTDLGAGTGRISFLLAPYVKNIFAFELTSGMLDQAKEKQKKLNVTNITFNFGDNRKIPLPDSTVDLVIAGWSFGMMMAWNLPDWEKVVDQALNEVNRIIKNNGTIIIIETQGTMKNKPEPLEFLIPLYNYLEVKYNFKCNIINTDYKFDSINEAIDLMSFFFDKEIGEEVKKRNSLIIPEFTGIWYKKSNK